MVAIRPHRVRDREGREARRNSATGGSGIRDADGRCRVGRGKREADYLRPDWTGSTYHLRWGRGQLRGLPSRQGEDGLEILGRLSFARLGHSRLHLRLEGRVRTLPVASVYDGTRHRVDID